MYYLAWMPAVNKGYSRSVIIGTLSGCILVYRYTKEGNINELRHNSMYGYENNRNSLVYRYTRTAPLKQSGRQRLQLKNEFLTLIRISKNG